MFNKLIITSLIFLLAGCQVTNPPSYQKDRKPEDRTEYNGVEGVMQKQKDQSYLMNKELSDKCEAAKIDLAIAESEGNEKDVEKQKELISHTCV